MDNFEKVEKLREKTGVSYEEAREALEAGNYDLLEAVIYLEKQGKISAPKVSSYTTTPENEPSQEFVFAQKTYEEDCNGTSIGDVFSKFVKWCGKIFKKGCEINFNVIKDGKKIISMPVIVLVMAGLFMLPLTVILVIVGLFCNFKYYFDGCESSTIDLNDLCDKASETCTNIKNDFQGKE